MASSGCAFWHRESGARIRDRVVLLAVEPKDKSRILLKTATPSKSKGKQAGLIAETLSLLLLDA